MTARTAIWRRAIAGLSGLLLAAGVLLGILAQDAAGGDLPLFTYLVRLPIGGAVYAGLGALVLSRHPRHPVGWILAALGLSTALEVANTNYLAYASQTYPNGIVDAPVLTRWALHWLHVPRFVLPVTVLLLLFPDGRLLSRRWWPIAVATALALPLALVSFAISTEPQVPFGVSIDNPLGLQTELPDAAAAIWGVPLLVAFAGALASVFVRFRRSTGIERQQMKWLVFALGVMLLSFPITSAVSSAAGEQLAQELTSVGQTVAFLGIAAAASIAVLRYRLYNIDLIINRTLVYGALTLIVAALYVAVVGSLGALLQARGSIVISLIATGVVAVLFQPLRDRLQRAVNRMLYGQRDEPYDVLSQLGRRMGGPAAPEAMLVSIVETVAQTLKLPYVAIALPEDGDDQITSETGRPGGEQMRLPLEYQGAHIGQLICAPRGPSEPFTEAEITLLRDIANQAAVAVHALKLSAALQRSRERLVSAREEERRRLRRDLHDGLGPQLASLGLKLDAARNQLQKDPRLADAILLQLRWEVQDAIADIRRLVYNLRPPALDELGLIPALRASAVAQLSPAGPRVVVEGPELTPSLPAAVEVAAFRIAQEAVTNVARHARAQQCTVRLQLENGLELEVIDDGAGLPEPLRAGVGLNSMQERAAELGGWFRIEGRPEGGTRVVAQIPFSVGAA